MKKNILAILILIPFLFFSQEFDENVNPFSTKNRVLKETSFTFNAQKVNFKDRNSYWKLLGGDPKDLSVRKLNYGRVIHFYDSYINYDNFRDGKTLDDNNKHKRMYSWLKSASAKHFTPDYYTHPTYWFTYRLDDINSEILRIVRDQKYLYEFNLSNFSIKELGLRDIIIMPGRQVLIKDSDQGKENLINEYELYNGEKQYYDFYLIVDVDDTITFNGLKSVDIDLNNWIEKYVRKKISKWQEKGEFEKTKEYNLRVTDLKRKEKIIDFEIESMKLLGKYFIENLSQGNEIIINDLDDNFSLSRYDADNETFVINIDFGYQNTNMVFNVPIEKARKFKEDFNSDKRKMWLTGTEFTVINNKLVLNYSKINHNGDLYTYDQKDQLSYVDTKIEYNFDPIKLNFNSSENTKPNISTNRIIVGKSPVDINIPVNRKVDNRYALIIGNEDYKSYQTTLSYEQNVDYAVNDATVFKNYALNTLGVKEENMFFLTNATSGQMSQEIERVSKIVSKIGKDAELIVYYAGHGYPDEINKVPYLIPVDISASNLDRAIKLDDFYTSLSSTNASRVTVFLDACFTGGGRSMGLYASRGIKVRPKTGVLKGNLVVFSASSSDQSSLPYHEEKHGMFTYHLLKKLQETKGDIDLGELSEYLEDEVSLQSLKVNKADQEPTVNISNQVTNLWKNWRF